VVSRNGVCHGTGSRKSIASLCSVDSGGSSLRTNARYRSGSFSDELFDGASDVFNLHIRIDAVLIEQITSLFSRLSAASATALMRSGRLFRPLCESPSSKPNLVAIPTCSQLPDVRSSLWQPDPAKYGALEA